MKLEAITPMLRTRDLKGSVEFYTRLSASNAEP